MKKKATRHYAHVAHAMHHHHAHKHLPKVFYHKAPLFPTIAWKSAFLLFICSFMGYFLVNNLAPQTVSLPTEQVVEDKKLLFSFDGTAQDWGVDPDSLNTHGAAANEFDFLFADAGNSPATGVSVVQPTVTPTTSGIKDQPIIPTVGSDTDIGGPSPVTTTTPTISQDPLKYAACSTPWGELVRHDDFILAYQQRTDDNSLCNVQKRYCNDGKLNGTYTQKSCREDLKYSYSKVIPTASNDPEQVNEYIQPSEPSMSGAKFDNHGKLVTSSTSNGIDNRSDSGKGVSTSTGPYITELLTNTTSCITPWKEKISDGQFVKAYKTPVGLIDMPCEVEIRLCTQGILKGSFKESSCAYKNMTYSDYLLDKGENTNTPNVIDMVNSTSTQSEKNTQSTSPRLWSWLLKYF